MKNEENMVAITATPNGPFIVEGNFKLIDREGKTEIRTCRSLVQIHILHLAKMVLYVQMNTEKITLSYFL